MTTKTKTARKQTARKQTVPATMTTRVLFSADDLARSRRERQQAAPVVTPRYTLPISAEEANYLARLVVHVNGALAACRQS